MRHVLLCNNSLNPLQFNDNYILKEIHKIKKITSAFFECSNKSTFSKVSIFMDACWHPAQYQHILLRSVSRWQLKSWICTTVYITMSPVEYVLPYNKTLNCHHVLFQSFLSRKTFERCCNHNKILFPNKQKNPDDIMIIITEVIISSENIFFGGVGQRDSAVSNVPATPLPSLPLSTPPNEGPPVTRLVSSYPLRYLCPD